MTIRAKTTLIQIATDSKQLERQLIYHNLFRQLRKARAKYQLKSNDLLVLNGIHLYTILIRSDFTQRNIIDFLGYYNHDRMNFYFNRLLEGDYIELYRIAGVRKIYKLTLKGYETVNDMFDSFDLSLRHFCEKHSIQI